MLKSDDGFELYAPNYLHGASTIAPRALSSPISMLSLIKYMYPRVPTYTMVRFTVEILRQILRHFRSVTFGVCDMQN